jgi:predicted DNA-binding protein
MKKITVRVEDYVYDRLFLVAKENSTSTNKVINTIVEKYINEPKEINYLKELNDKLQIIIDYLEKISKRQYKHFKLSQQHFANFGYLSNADINEDKCLNEILNNKDTFNE